MGLLPTEEEIKSMMRDYDDGMQIEWTGSLCQLKKRRHADRVDRFSLSAAGVNWPTEGS